eukprot:GILI01012570.1.p2 GENE.GILI01012570.1~~GILI01012570.1.p2  ORF type:complete len:204 (+),score=14.16 GILI01012570.1:102-713(+)
MCTPRREPSVGGNPAPLIESPNFSLPWVCCILNIILCVISAVSSNAAVRIAEEDCTLPLEIYMYVTSGLAGVNALSFSNFARTKRASDEEWAWKLIMLCATVIFQLAWMCVGCYFAFGPYAGTAPNDCVTNAQALHYTTLVIVVYYVCLIGVEITVVVIFSTQIFVNPESKSALALKSLRQLGSKKKVEKASVCPEDDLTDFT